MKNTSKPHSCKTTITIAAAAIALTAATAQRASAQMIANIFAGDNGTNATAVSTLPSLVTLNTNNSAIIGPGFLGKVGLLAGVADTETATLNPAAAPGTLTISETSAVGLGVADVGGTFSVDKTFTGVNLSVSTPYQLTLTKSQTTLLNAISNLTVTFTLGTTVINTTNLLTLLQTSGNNTASVNFTTPATLTQAGPLEITIAGANTAGVINQSLVFTGASFTEVPEPGAGTYLVAGLGLLVSAHWVRRGGKLAGRQLS